ncbi:MAG: DSD1 family PLP-dependent enzyme [Pseudomonadales bacterium]|jgi:D-serine deaminase-like pyridoxal phosphate-dependent protein|nr:DSD1 family PLP-dependent enzyme [Pseudomonadales bacterium]
MAETLETFLAARTARPADPVALAEPVPLEALPTPALVVDVAALDRNLRAMQGFLEARGVGLRPHAKMHRCPVVARRQLALGAIGVCAAKVAEAEVLRAAGIERILVTSPVTAPQAMERLAALAARSEDVRVVVDDAGAAARLGEAARAAGTELAVLVDLDPDMGRTGIARGAPALELVRTVVATPGLRFTGLQQYAGQLQHLTDAVERRARSREAMEAGLETRALVEADGHPVDVFTGGGTGTFDVDSEIDGVTDLQCGSYAFMDEEYGAVHQGGSDRFAAFEPALFLLSTVISRPRPGAVTVDAGIKSLATDAARPVPLDLPGVRYRFAGDEHGVLIAGEGAPLPALGDRVRLLTSHCDPTVNLHDWLYPVRDGLVHELWPVAARGCSW